MERLRAHLRGVERLGVSVWYMQDILPGTEWRKERDRQLQAAHLLLLLVSPDFLSASEQSEKEVPLIMQRHQRGEAHALPIILRSVSWQDTPFGKLAPLPSDGHAVAAWKDRDLALTDVVEGIRRVINTLRSPQPTLPGPSQKPEVAPPDRAKAVAQLDQLIQNFRQLRGQIAKSARFQGEPGFTLEVCEKQYNKLYGDTIAFLALYLPERLTSDEEGFAEAVHRKTSTQLHERDDPFVLFTRMVVARLARFERIAEQIDACVATLEFYKRKYFHADAH